MRQVEQVNEVVDERAFGVQPRDETVAVKSRGCLSLNVDPKPWLNNFKIQHQRSLDAIFSMYYKLCFHWKLFLIYTLYTYLLFCGVSCSSKIFGI